MTPEDEYSTSLLGEAQEINFQMNILVQDITWIKEKIKTIHDKILSDPFADRENNVKELNFLINKHRINMEAREKLKSKNNELGVRINEFFGKNVWEDL